MRIFFFLKKKKINLKYVIRLQISSSVMTVGLLIVSIAFYMEVGAGNDTSLIQYHQLSYLFN